jgi:serine/threonine-protein kinase
MQQVRNHASREHWKQLNRAVITEGQAQSRVKPGMAIAIFRECLHGLASLHAANMVHNDLKPSNIMLKRSGNVKIIDIGSAFSLNDTPNTVACTPEFAAPEVLVGDRATAQSDLASLGYVLLEMLSGTRLFCDMKFKAMLAAKQNILQSLPTILPSEEFAYFDLLLPFLRRLVAPNPKDRFPSAEEADQAADGAAAFEEELVKGDLSHSYEIDIREWIKEIDGVILDHNLPSTKFLS